MYHEITIDQQTQIIRLIHRDVIRNHDLWSSSHAVIGRLTGLDRPKILIDLRGAAISVDDWDRHEFMEAHRHLIKRHIKIAGLVDRHNPHYAAYVQFAALFAFMGVKAKLFDNEYEAESWLLQEE